MSSVDIRISDHSPDILLTLKDDKSPDSFRTKIVSRESLIEAISKDYIISTGFLPSGTRFFTGGKTKFSMGIETPAMVKKLSIRFNRNDGEDKYREVSLPIPYCIFVFDIIDSKVFDSRAFALKEPSLNGNGELCVFPYGNVASNDGYICWGSVSLPKINEPINVVSLIGLFFGSTFNSDLFNTDSTAKGFSFAHLINEVEGKDSFPMELLRKTDITIKTLMKGRHEHE